MSFAVTTLTTNLYPQLHAAAAADLVFWSDTELFHYIAEAAKRLVQKYGVRIVRDTTSVTISTGQAVYLCPPRHMSTIHVALNGRALRPISTMELERKDSQYQTRAATATTPVRWWYQDRNLVNHIGLYPVPSSDYDGLKLEVIFHQYICGPDFEDETIDSPQFLDIPLWAGDYLEVAAASEAYKRESDAQMVESGQGYGALADLYEQIAQSYWEQAE